MLLELSVIPLGRGRSISSDITDLVKIIVSASLKRIHFRRFGVGHLARRRVRNTPVRWLLHTSKQS